jgi:two-component system KDP operon response regulator KdpE
MHASGRCTRVLILTSEAELGRLLRTSLQPACKVTIASPVPKKLEVGAEGFDVLLIDLEPFDLDVVAQVQSAYKVVAISREYREADCIEVLEKGADYLVRPFRKHDLLARVHVAELRLFNATNRFRYCRHGALVVDLFDRMVFFDGQPVALSPSQMKVLMLLASRSGMPVSYDRILSTLGATDSPSRRRALHSLVFLLRRQIERDPRHPEVLLAEIGFGYRLAASPVERLPRNADPVEGG